jgi:asparagine synthase (glutamine-hydrolysing)
MPSFNDIIETLSFFDEPLGVIDSIMSVPHCRAISEHRRVVLSGSGADEVFGGYESYIDIVSGGTATARCTSEELLAATGADFRERSHRDAELLFVPALRDRVREIDWGQDIAWLMDIATLDTRLDMKLMVELLLGMSHCASMFDTVGMMSSIEIRSPMLNHKIMQFAARLHPHHKVTPDGPYKTKRLLKQLAERHMPMEIVRRKKTGYALGFDPFAAIFGPWRTEIDALLHRREHPISEFINIDQMRRVLDRSALSDATEFDRRRTLKSIMLLAWVESRTQR